MRIQRRRLGEKGVATVLVGMLLVLFMTCIGLAVDLGRIYIVRAALSAAVDGASLAAARQISQGTGAATTAATKVFNANFPSGFLGTTAVNLNINVGVASDGSDLITLTANATLPTLFMQLGGVSNLDFGSRGQATRRLIDMAFVIDRSGSLGSQFPAVKTASANFVDLFDATNDRIALLSFSTNVRVLTAISTPARGFNKGTVKSNIAGIPLGGTTATAEGLYQAWDQLRLVPTNNQSGLRVVVLFTDGVPNTWSGVFPKVATNCTAGGGNTPCAPSGAWMAFPPGVRGMLTTSDYPAPAGQNNPEVVGLRDPYNISENVWIAPTNAGGGGRYTSGTNVIKTTVNPGIPELPALSTSTPLYGSAGIVTTFLLYDATLPHQHPMIGGPPVPNHVQNANNAARNLMESVANAIRSDTSGKARIHIFTLGLGPDLNLGTGSDLETGSSMLRRIANDPSSADYNANQPDGGYFFAGSTSELQAAFEAIRDRIIRISQ